MDFVGELTRTAVIAATSRDVAAVERATVVVEDLQMVRESHVQKRVSTVVKCLVTHDS